MKNWKVWLGIIISGIFIWFSLRQIKDWHQFAQSFQQLHYWAFFPALFGYALILIIRAWRWHYILKSQQEIRFSSSLISLVICYMANNILPFRAGEVIRAIVLARREKEGFSPVFATVVVERIFDSLLILVFLAVLLFRLQIPSSYQEIALVLRKGGIIALTIAVILVVFLYLIYYAQAWVLGVSDKVFSLFGEKIHQFVLAELKKFSQGLLILGKPYRLLVVAIFSFFVWAVNLLPIYFVGLSFGYKFSVMGMVLILFLGAFSAAIPAAPGFWGTFHYITTQGILLLGAMPKEKALSFAIVLHAFYYFPVLIVGLILAWREGYSLSELEKEAEKARE